MPRGPRMIPDHGVFHITIRGNNKRCVFRRDCDYIRFELLLAQYKKKYDFYLYHYTLMKNHVHIIIKSTKKTDISKAMQGIALAYYHYYRRKNGYVGHLWQGRFKSFIIDNDRYLLRAALYVEKNPLEAGLVKHLLEYRWSSYRYYALGEANPIVDTSPMYQSLDLIAQERQRVYRELMLSRIAESRSRWIDSDCNSNA